MLIRDTVANLLVSRFRKPTDSETGYETQTARQIQKSENNSSRMMEEITLLHDYVKNYSQKNPASELYKELETIFPPSEASACGATSCKVLTFWIEATVKKLMEISYVDYFRKLIDDRLATPENAYLLIDLESLAGEFKIEIATYSDYQEIFNYRTGEFWYGTLRFRPNGGWHSMIIYNTPGEGIKTADTSYRLFGSDTGKYLTKRNFKYLTVLG